MMDNRQKGSWGEERAARYLRLRAYRILEKNYRCRLGEIDLIARRGGFLVFVEVKLRKSDRFGEAREFVGRAKQERILATAQLWMQEHETSLQPRFDVIEIYAPNGTDTRHPAIRHLENAFSV
jgi:putative endonuclease